MMRVIKFYLIFLILFFSQQFGFAHEITTVCQPPIGPISTDIHYIAIIDHAAGSFISTAHDFLFQQLYCGLNDAKKARVKFDSWHIDSDLGECKIYDSNNSITNIHGKIFENFDVIPPSQTRSNLCEKLLIAKSCASFIPVDQKIEIAIPMLLHEELGKCDLEKIFSFKDHKIVIFWTNDYYRRENDFALPPNVDLIVFGPGIDFLPHASWKPNSGMIDALKYGKSEMTKSLNHRFEEIAVVKKKNSLRKNRITTTTPLTTTTSTSSTRPSTPSTTTTTTTTVKVVKAGIGLPSGFGFPFFQPKLTKTTPHQQPLTSLPSIKQLPTKRNRTFIFDYSDVEALRASGGAAPKWMNFNKHKNRLNTTIAPVIISTSHMVTTPTTQPSKSITVDINASTPVDIMTTTTPPKITTTHQPEGFFVIFGRIAGRPEHGLIYFIIFLITSIFLTLLLLLCIWCCCCKEPVKGKYEVLEKERAPLNAEPNPEAGIAYSSEAFKKPLISKSMVSRRSVKARKPKKNVNHVTFKDENDQRQQQSSENTNNNNTNIIFGSPQQSTPPSSYPIETPPEPGHFSPPPLTPAQSQISQAAGPRSVKFDISRDDPQTIPELKALSDENLWSNRSTFNERF